MRTINEIVANNDFYNQIRISCQSIISFVIYDKFI